MNTTHNIASSHMMKEVLYYTFSNLDMNMDVRGRNGHEVFNIVTLGRLICQYTDIVTSNIDTQLPHFLEFADVPCGCKEIFDRRAWF